VAELHKLHKGQSPAESEMNFLEHAKRLEMYGISLHPGKDSAGRDIQLGVTSIGLVVFQASVKINTFSWTKIVKISFKRKQFFIQLRKELTESYDTLLGFNLSSYRSCKNLWKSAVEHHSFFRLQSPQQPPRKFPVLWGLSSKFRYSGRTEFQTVSESALAANQSKSRWDRAFFRSPSRRALRQTLPNLERTRQLLASPEHSSIGSSTKGSSLSSTTLKPGGKPLNNGSRVSLAVRAYESFNNRVQSLGVRSPRRAWGEDSDDDGGFLASTLPRLRGQHAPSLPPGLPSLPPPSSSPSTQGRTSPVDLSAPPTKFSYVDDSSSERGSEIREPGRASSEPPVSAASTARIVASPPLPPAAPASELPTASSPLLDEVMSEASGSSAASTGIVTVSILPDVQGRFGFNVKGGADQGLPVIVSRVAGSTPADRCVPRLNEGDQVVLINGREVSSMSHDQVVNFIRAAREPHSGSLVLAVRQVSHRRFCVAGCVNWVITAGKQSNKGVHAG
jgi:tyrosine-protein phosphatase non-receptor type 4